ncbi:MAG: DUF1508 domain-containing protein [Proteobacteria bacterium]|nr:DUF1508 domain-containing protein [Pseudomonadota bacterium]
MAGEPNQFVIYKDMQDDWRWRLFAANAEKIAESGEGYKNRVDCIHGVRLVAATATKADIWDGATKQWI